MTCVTIENAAGDVLPAAFFSSVGYLGTEPFELDFSKVVLYLFLRDESSPLWQGCVVHCVSSSPCWKLSTRG